jgi:CheY-like chemotaxis protein
MAFPTLLLFIVLAVGLFSLCPTRGSGRNNDNLIGVRVLVVDDNATNCRIVRHQLEAWKMSTESAAGGEDALGLLRAAASVGLPFQVALLDIQMPVMSGWELAAIIRAELALAPTSLIALTSVGQEVAPEELKAAGVEDYLVKPVKQLRLFECLARAVGQPEFENARNKSTAPNLAALCPVPGLPPEKARIL